MFASSLHRETLTVTPLTPGVGGSDADGLPATSPATPIPLVGCNVQPTSTTATDDDGRQVDTTYRVSAPGIGWALADGWPVVWRLPGTWRIDGDPLEWAGTGALDHTEFTIRRVKGG